MSQLIEHEIEGVKYEIGLHPGFPEGMQLAFKVQNMLQQHILQAQEQIADALSPEETKAIQDNPDKAAEIMQAKLKPSDMIRVTRTMIGALDPDAMFGLAKDLLKYTFCPDGALSQAEVLSKHFRGNFKSLMPLMSKIIEENGFLDLDATAML